MKDEVYLSAVDSGLVKPKNNPTDFDSFKKFQNEIEERYSRVEKERIIRERQSNLEQWDNSLPPRWKGASLAKMNNPAAEKALNIIKNDGNGGFFITGNAGSGKTFLSYAIIRKYIGKGWTTFSQVKIVSEESLLGLGYMGFEGRSRFEKMFDRRYNTYFFDNVGEKETYDNKREIPLWERFIDHIYSNSLNAIFTSNYDIDSFANVLSDSGRAKFEALIGNRIIEINGTRSSQNRNNMSNILDNFSD